MGVVFTFFISRRHDDVADEEGHVVRGGDAVLHGRDRLGHRLHS